MFIKFMAAVFAVYEFYKMFNAEKYAVIIEQIKKKAFSDQEAAAVMEEPFVRKVFFIELAYTIFAITLLFTAYWYFILILLSVSFIVFTINARLKTSTMIIGMGSAACAAILVSIMLA